MPSPPKTYEERADRADERSRRATQRAEYAHGRRQLAVHLPARDMWAKEARRHEETAKLETKKAATYRHEADQLEKR